MPLYKTTDQKVYIFTIPSVADHDAQHGYDPETGDWEPYSKPVKVMGIATCVQDAERLISGGGNVLITDEVFGTDDRGCYRQLCGYVQPTTKEWEDATWEELPGVEDNESTYLGSTCVLLRQEDTEETIEKAKKELLDYLTSWWMK